MLALQRVFELAGFCCQFGAPAPKPGALPTGPHPDIKLREKLVVVKYVVKGYFRPEQGRSQEKILVPQQVFGVK